MFTSAFDTLFNCFNPSYTPIRVDTTELGNLSNRTREGLATLLVQATNILLCHPDPVSTQLVPLITNLYKTLYPLYDISISDTIKYQKELVTFFVAFMRGGRGRFKPTTFYWSKRYSCPTHLLPIVRFLAPYRSSITEPHILRLFQTVLLILNMHRIVMVKLPKGVKHSINTSSITTPTSSTPDAELIDLIPLALDQLGMNNESFLKRYISNLSSFRPYVISSSGPNGSAMWNGYKDAYAFLQHTPLGVALDKFLSPFGKDLAFPTGSVIFSLVLTLRQAAARARLQYSASQLKTFVTSRLHMIPELGGKLRVVAIVDYWTQMFLSPLHDTINSFLRVLPMDGTFKQGESVRRVRTWTGNPLLEVYSYDLTAATDRLPIWFQREVLAHLIHPTVADGWVGLCTNRRFVLPGIPKNAVANTPGTFVKYACGQPMGAKSSFPMLALSHHVIVQLAYIIATRKRLGLTYEQLDEIPTFIRYTIVGDDNTLTNPLVASEYLRIMQSLGMEISMSKSYSHEAGALSVGEICKRIFIEGFELSAFNPKLLVKCYFDSRLISDFQNDWVDRGRPINESVLVDFICTSFKRRALRIFLVLNSAPHEINGLAASVDVSPYFQSLHSRYGLTENILISLYHYVLYVSQLGRLDALMKVTETIQNVLAYNARANKGAEAARRLIRGIKPARLRTIDSLPAVGDPHPLAIAASWEYVRVMNALSRMMDDDAVFRSNLRSGILDSVRNTLSSVWLDTAVSRGPIVADRTTFNKFLKHLEYLSDSLNRRRFQFEIYIISLRRRWCVQWFIDRGVVVSPYGLNLANKVQIARANLSKVSSALEIKGWRL